jgi:uncharacterized protein YneF (UPF0154 family)
VRYEIESLTARLANLDNRVNYSSVYIAIRVVEKLTKQEPINQTYGQYILEGFNNTLAGVGFFFMDVLRILIVNLPILAILAVVAVAGAHIARRSIKKRRGGGDTESKDDNK